MNMQDKTVLLVSICTCIVCVTCTLYITWTLEDLEKLRTAVSANCKCAHASSIQVNDLRDGHSHEGLFVQKRFILMDDKSKLQARLRRKRQAEEDCKALKKKFRQCRKRRKNRNKNKRRNKQQKDIKTPKVQEDKSAAASRIMKISKEKTTVTWKPDMEFYNTRSVVPPEKGFSCTSMWEGTYCYQNDTYRNKDHNTRITFFQRVPWNADLNSNLVKQNDNGAFNVEVSGLYIVFFQTTVFNPTTNINTTRNMETIALMHYRNGKNLMTKLTCIVGSQNPDITFYFYYPHYTSCTISSVLYLERNDSVFVLLLQPETVIEISPDSTYFGLFLLSKKQ